jgi:hypothetical protein
VWRRCPGLSNTLRRLRRDSIRFDSIRFDDDREGRAGWIVSQRAMDGDGRDGGEDAVVDVDARCDETKRV